MVKSKQLTKSGERKKLKNEDEEEKKGGEQ